jgi:hypothetical protein
MGGEVGLSLNGLSGSEERNDVVTASDGGCCSSAESGSWVGDKDSISSVEYMAFGGITVCWSCSRASEIDGRRGSS